MEKYRLSCIYQNISSFSSDMGMIASKFQGSVEQFLGDRRVEVNNVELNELQSCFVFQTFKPVERVCSATPLLEVKLLADLLIDILQQLLADLTHVGLGRIDEATFDIVGKVVFVIFYCYIGIFLRYRFDSITYFQTFCYVSGFPIYGVLCG